MMMTTAIHCLTLPCMPRNPSLTTTLSLSSHPKLATFRPLSNLLSHGPFSKGFLSINTIGRPTRQSVVCMARRYGANTRKRKIQNRRKGGDREKKKKRRRKAARKNKDSFKIIWLVSAAGTGYVYAKRKGKKSEKLEIKKYDPDVRHHVLFKESK
ncbi:hypothetical protein OIU79_026606 [Salix purpurea]|uniref:50S ribosomal protein L33, chloroplastic n=1 Tax=Salix purpurea TaxID=77065 RepID=A0A9Q0VU98_SALPP|nr:hypothetical protein OIU79_026606 [Salix purpurea]